MASRDRGRDCTCRVIYIHQLPKPLSHRAFLYTPHIAFQLRVSFLIMNTTPGHDDDVEVVNRTAGDDGNVEEARVETTPAWKPSRQELMIMLTLSTISFMVSLDATVIITSLSVIKPYQRSNPQAS